MKLYDLKAGMNPRRVRIFLAEKKISLPTVDVDMLAGDNRTPAFLGINPLGKLPVLELDDGSHLSESIAICRYLEEMHPEPNLFGSTAKERALIEMWTRRIELELAKPMSDQFVHLSPFYANRVQQVAQIGEAARVQVAETLAWLDRELANRPFIAAERYTIADIAAQCAVVLGKNTGMPLSPHFQNLARWWAGVSTRPTARA